MIKETSCLLPWSHLRLANNGYYCCCEIVSFGADVNNFQSVIWSSLQEAWNSKYYQELRSNMHSKGVDSVCNKHGFQPFQCKFWPRMFPKTESQTVFQNTNIDKMVAAATEGLTKVAHYPYHIQIIMDAKCNLACEHCFQEPYKRNDNRIVIPDLHDELIEFAKHAVTIEIIGGEATLYKDYIVLLDLIKEAQGAKLSLVTNGHFLKDKVVPYLDLYHHVGISIDAATSDTYAIMRPSPSKKYNWINLCEQIKALVDANNARIRPVRIDMNATICGHNYHEMAEMIENAYSLGVKLFYFNEIMDDDYTWLSQSKKESLLNHLNKGEQMYDCLQEAIIKARELGVQLYYSLPSIRCIGSSSDLDLKPFKPKNVKPLPIVPTSTPIIQTNCHWAIVSGKAINVLSSLKEVEKTGIKKIIYFGNDPAVEPILINKYVRVITLSPEKLKLSKDDYTALCEALFSENYNYILNKLLKLYQTGLTADHVYNACVDLKNKIDIPDDIDKIFSRLPGLPQLTDNSEYTVIKDISRLLNVESYFEIGARHGHGLLAVSAGCKLKHLGWCGENNNEDHTLENVEFFFDLYGNKPELIYTRNVELANIILGKKKFDWVMVSGSPHYTEKIHNLFVAQYAKPKLITIRGFSGDSKKAIIEWSQKYSKKIYSLDKMAIIDCTTNQEIIEKLKEGGSLLQSA